MEKKRKPVSFMERDLLRDISQEEVARVAHEVFGNISKITVAKTFDNDGTTFDINYVMNENPDAFNSTLLSGKPLKLTKLGFVDDGSLIPEGMLQVIELLSTAVKPQDAEAFEENFLTHINIAFANQIMRDFIQNCDNPEKSKKETTKEYEESVHYLGEFIYSLRTQLGLTGDTARKDAQIQKQ